VNFHVEPVGTEGRERLVLEVWTDGSVSRAPRSAKPRASSRTTSTAHELPEATPQEEAAERDETHPRTELNENLFRNVDELELSVRASTASRPRTSGRSPTSCRRARPSCSRPRISVRSPERDQNDPGRDEPVAGMRLDPEELERLRSQYERAYEA